jgi:hypothetical protein
MSARARAVLAAIVTAAAGIGMSLGFDLHELAGLVTTLIETAAAIIAVAFAVFGGNPKEPA